MFSFTRIRTIRGAALAACAVASSFWGGCTDMKYITHADQSLKGEKVPSSTIAVFPIDKLNYQPPKGCMSIRIGTDLGDSSKFQNEWNKKLQVSLTKKFPKQKLIFLSTTEGLLKNGSVDFYSICELSKKFARSEQINALKPDSIVYESMITSPDIQTHLKKIQDSIGAQYALVFISPQLSGNISTNYTPGDFNPVTGASTGGSFSFQTYYTADIQTLVWECSTGRLLYSSGAWCNTTSYCFFISPESAAIDGANQKFNTNLMKVISYLLDYDALRYTIHVSH